VQNRTYRSLDPRTHGWTQYGIDTYRRELSSGYVYIDALSAGTVLGEIRVWPPDTDGTVAAQVLRSGESYMLTINPQTRTASIRSSLGPQATYAFDMGSRQWVRIQDDGLSAARPAMDFFTAVTDDLGGTAPLSEIARQFGSLLGATNGKWPGEDDPIHDGPDRYQAPDGSLGSVGCFDPEGFCSAEFQRCTGDSSYGCGGSGGGGGGGDGGGGDYYDVYDPTRAARGSGHWEAWNPDRSEGWGYWHADPLVSTSSLVRCGDPIDYQWNLRFGFTKHDATGKARDATNEDCMNRSPLINGQPACRSCCAWENASGQYVSTPSEPDPECACFPADVGICGCVVFGLPCISAWP